MVELRSYLEIIHPNRFPGTIERELKNPDLKVTIVNFLILAALSLIITAFSYLYLPRSAAATGSPLLNMIQSYRPLASPLSIALTAMTALVFPYVTVFIMQSVAKALGGKGRYLELAYLVSILDPIVQIIQLPFTVFLALWAGSMVGQTALSGGLSNVCLLCFFDVFVFALSLYFIYVRYRILRAVNPTLSKERAIIAFIGGTAIAIVASVAVFFARIIIGA